MIEITVRDHLAGKCQVEVHMEVPANPPQRFVVLRKGDSSRENYLDKAIFVADSYAESLLEAAKLNEQVKTIMDDLIELNEICCVRRSGDYPNPDTASKRYRYQAVFDITHY